MTDPENHRFGQYIKLMDDIWRGIAVDAVPDEVRLARFRALRECYKIAEVLFASVGHTRVFKNAAQEVTRTILTLESELDELDTDSPIDDGESKFDTAVQHKVPW